MTTASLENDQLSNNRLDVFKSNITKIDLNLDEKIITHYDRVFNPSSIITPNNNAPVIRLFED